MRVSARSIFSFLLVFLSAVVFSDLFAQSNSGSVGGTVTDPSGAVVPGATVSIQNPVSKYSRTATTDRAGHFQFPNVPLNPYHLTVVDDWIWFHRPGCRRQLDRTRQLEHPPSSEHGVHHCDRTG